MERINMKRLFWRWFKLTCWVLFLYQTFKCFEKFFQQKTATKNSYVNQEKYPRYSPEIKEEVKNIFSAFPRPSICLGSVKFTHLNKSMQALIPGRNYTRGQWRSNKFNMDEEELFDHLTLELSDLLNFIRINKHDKGEPVKGTESSSFGFLYFS